ncbi:MAG: hypothetical protein ACK559_31575, partial [bacterium]
PVGRIDGDATVYEASKDDQPVLSVVELGGAEVGVYHEALDGADGKIPWRDQSLGLRCRQKGLSELANVGRVGQLVLDADDGDVGLLPLCDGFLRQSHVGRQEVLDGLVGRTRKMHFSQAFCRCISSEPNALHVIASNRPVAGLRNSLPGRLPQLVECASRSLDKAGRMQLGQAVVPACLDANRLGLQLSEVRSHPLV